MLKNFKDLYLKFSTNFSTKNKLHLFLNCLELQLMLLFTILMA